MKTGKCVIMAVLLGSVLMLSGCSAVEELTDLIEPEWVPTESALQVKEDGTITETLIEHLDQGYYDAEELERMIKVTVSEYREAHGGDTLRIDELLIENGVVRLVMTYQTAADYAAYNNVRFYNGSMLGAEMEGFLFYNQFHQVEDGLITSADLSNEEALKHKEYQVLVTENCSLVEVPGKVVYISANSVPEQEEKRRIRKEALVSVSQEGLVLPSSTVFVEEKHEPVSAKDLEKNYLYIVYEY